MPVVKLQTGRTGKSHARRRDFHLYSQLVGGEKVFLRTVLNMETDSRKLPFILTIIAVLALLYSDAVRAWTGEIHGRVVCDVCGDSSVGPEDQVLAGLR